MSSIRTELEKAKGAYRANRYPGDLAEELLPARRKMALGFWMVPAAVAALLAVVLWPHQPPGDHSRDLALRDNSQTPVHPTTVARPDFRDLRGIQYSMYVSQVRTGVEGAISQLGDGFDAALDAPLVTDSVEGVKHVAGEIREVATVTWSQIKPRGPGC